MTIRFNTFVPYTPLQAADVNDIAKNGCVQVTAFADLADADLAEVNVAFVADDFQLYIRTAAGNDTANWTAV